MIVEVDENQHSNYEYSCECSRISEIVGGIGDKSVIIIRYNPDNIKNKGKKVNISNSEKIDLLVETIKTELTKNYNKFVVKIKLIFYFAKLLIVLITELGTIDTESIPSSIKNLQNSKLSLGA